MFAVLRDHTYRHLFGAHVVALTGTGLATVALGLLAYDVAGPDAGAVLGTALAIKMVAYVGVAPIAAAVLGALPRRTVLVTLDLVRAAVAVTLPFVDQVWQVYVLIFVLQAASAAFTPLFQATIPEVLPNEREYTRALTLSRMAYDLEGLLSPSLAAALLLLMSFNKLFLGTAIGFVASALLVVSTVVPRPKPVRRKGGLYEATTRGVRIYLATPRLRGLLAVHLAAAAAGSMVLVNTVAYVRDVLGRGAFDVAAALAFNGVGSLAAALVLPKLLDRVTDRVVVLRAAVVLVALLLVGATFASSRGDGHWLALLVLWALIGAGCSLRPHTRRAAAAPVRVLRRPDGVVRRRLRAVPRLLAGVLPAGRMGRQRREHDLGVPRARRCDGGGRADRAPVVAAARPRGRRTSSTTTSKPATITCTTPFSSAVRGGTRTSSASTTTTNGGRAGRSSAAPPARRRDSE